jgi:hypothetical protein
MTFSVLLVDGDQQRKVIGTVWANEESQANALAKHVCAGEAGQVLVERCEDREIPLKLPN